MSSFICNAEHFNSIQTNLIEVITKKKEDFYLSGILIDLLPRTAQGLTDWECEIIKVINTLKAINVLTVTYQYAHHVEGDILQEIALQLDIVNMETKTKELSTHGLYNALVCLDYQIEIEHLADKRGLTPNELHAMQVLNELINAFARHIVRRLPDDNTNTWSISI